MEQGRGKNDTQLERQINDWQRKQIELQIYL